MSASATNPSPKRRKVAAGDASPRSESFRKRLEEKKSEWLLDDEKITAAVDRLVGDGAEFDARDTLRLFLYAKGILAGEDAIVRTRKFNNLLKPDEASILKDEKTKLKSGLLRLTRIVTLGEDCQEETPTFVKLCEKIAAWGDAKQSYVVFRDHPKLSGKKTFVERVQKSGLCYMHAPIVLQHYLVQMSTDEPVMMLDLGIYLRQHMDAHALYAHIWEDNGGSSVAFLRHILSPRPKPVVGSNMSPSEWLANLKAHGPLLVSAFKVYPSFRTESRITYREARADSGEELGLHAMVLVGHRKDGDTDLFLLQNWWKKKPFIEVTAAFLESCDATVHVVKTPQSEIKYPVGKYAHIESEHLDTGEQYALEWFH